MRRKWFVRALFVCVFLSVRVLFFILWHGSLSQIDTYDHICIHVYIYIYIPGEREGNWVMFQSCLRDLFRDVRSAKSGQNNKTNIMRKKKLLFTMEKLAPGITNLPNVTSLWKIILKCTEIYWDCQPCRYPTFIMFSLTCLIIKISAKCFFLVCHRAGILFFSGLGIISLLHFNFKSDNSDKLRVG